MTRQFETGKIKIVLAAIFWTVLLLFISVQHGDKIKSEDRNLLLELFGAFAVIVMAALLLGYKKVIVNENGFIIKGITGKTIDSYDFDEIDKMYSKEFSYIRYLGNMATNGSAKLLAIHLKDGRSLELNISDFTDQQGLILALREGLGEHRFVSPQDEWRL